jgi:hypothetical protein
VIDTANRALDEQLADEREIIRKLEAGFRVEPGRLQLRIVTGILRGRVTKRVQFIDTSTRKPTLPLSELFDGGLLM